MYQATLFLNTVLLLFQMIMPPKTIPQPMRLTSRYVKVENLVFPPTLNEGEGEQNKIDK
jgi:hypothetical protein